MRIISGFRDYYDYIANQNIDNKIVYERHCVEYKDGLRLVGPHKADILDLFDRKVVCTIHFCGTRYKFIFSEGEFIYDLKIMFDMVKAIKKYEDTRSLPGYYSLATSFFSWDKNFRNFETHNQPSPTDLNAKLNTPVVLEFPFSANVGHSQYKAYFTNIRLASIGFPAVIAPEQAFMQIYNFLIPAEVQPDINPDNMNRYEAKGFDLKTSFRKEKKE